MTFKIDDVHAGGHTWHRDRIIGTFPNGVESLCAVPSGWWTRWLTHEEAQQALVELNQLEDTGKIDWSQQFPTIK